MPHVKFSRFFAMFILVLFAMSGCKKDAGIGGTSTIKGKVIVHDFDAAFQEANPRAIYPAPKVDAYIIYGADGTTYDDHYTTSYDGTYEFKYLQKGVYKIFAYTKDTTGAKTTGNFTGRKIPSLISVEIKSNGSTIDAPDIIILDNNF